MEITLRVTFADEDVRNGWDDEPEELLSSVRATLSEVIGDDGMPYIPIVTPVIVDGVER